MVQHPHPGTGVPMRPLPRNLITLLPDFWHCNLRLWRDRLGQISLATTTLFWGVSGNLRYIVLAWAAVSLGLQRHPSFGTGGRGGHRHRSRCRGGLASHALGAGNAGDAAGHWHGAAGDLAQLH